MSVRTGIGESAGPSRSPHRRARRAALALGLGCLLGAFALISDLFGTRPLEQAAAQQPDAPAKDDAAPKDVSPQAPAPEGHGVVYPFRSGMDRLSRMPGIPGPIGSTPMPSPEQLDELRKFFPGPPIDPQYTIDLVQDRIRLFRLAAPPTQTQLGNPAIVGFNLLTPREMTIVGRQVGTTVLNLWFKNPTDPNKEEIFSFLVRVLPDPEAKERLERAYQALEKDINQHFVNSRVHLVLVGDKLVVTGECKDVLECTQILRILHANAPQAGQNTRIPLLPIGTVIDPHNPLNPGGVPGMDAFNTAVSGNIINLLKIPGEQLIMLKVAVAEVNRTAARTIGMNWSYTNAHGITLFSQLTGGITTAGGNLPFVLDNGRIPVGLQALKTLNYARSLAEPNITTLNGKPAQFFAGGEFPVPVIGGFANTLQSTQFVPFGVQLYFIPVITDRDRIRLTLQGTVSTRDTAVSTQIGASNVSGLSSRNFNMTVEMREGQTMAVAGLIQNNLASDRTGVPFLSDIPILNRFFTLDDMQHGEQELVVLVTPELVHPLEPREVPRIPGSDIFEPNDLEYFLLGRLESLRSYDFRSPVMNNIHRMIRYRHCSAEYIFGPVGHTDEPPVPMAEPGVGWQEGPGTPSLSGPKHGNPLSPASGIPPGVGTDTGLPVIAPPPAAHPPEIPRLSPGKTNPEPMSPKGSTSETLPQGGLLTPDPATPEALLPGNRDMQ